MDNKNQKQAPSMGGRGPMGGGRGPMGHGGGFGGKKQPLNKGALKRLIKYLGQFKFRLLIVFICILLSSVTGSLSAVFLGKVIDDYIMPLMGNKNPVFDELFKFICLMAGVYITAIIASFTQTRLMVTVSQGVQNKIRKQMFVHMQKLPIKYFDTNLHGDIMSHYTNDIDTLRQMLSQSIPQMFSSSITVVSVFVTMIITNIWLTLFVIAYMFFMFSVVKNIGGKSSKYFIKQQKSIGDINGYIEEMMTGQKVVKVFSHEEKIKQEFDQKNEEVFQNASSANRFASSMMPLMGNLSNLQYVLIAVLGGLLASFGIGEVVIGSFSFGKITLGVIASFLLLSQHLAMPINQVSQQMNSIIMALAGAGRIFELLDQPVETDDGKVTLVKVKKDKNGEFVETTDSHDTYAWRYPHSNGQVEYIKLTGDVHLDDVDFGYNEEKLVLHNITIDALEGQKIAFVGATGAGKTTITNLINRFYDIADGKIRYDGININKIKKADLRHSLGIVLQDVNLFTGTVMENIRYGKLDATDEECIAASKRANAHEFITMLADGYDTILEGDGSSLSQGQRQLISIARAAVADPPVMILDEATSSIDSRTEALVQKGMDALMYGRTVFVIAHRLSTIQNSDKIMVLNHGRIIESGNHDELMALKGEYYQLYTGALEID